MSINKHLIQLVFVSLIASKIKRLSLFLEHQENNFKSFKYFFIISGMNNTIFCSVYSTYTRDGPLFMDNSMFIVSADIVPILMKGKKPKMALFGT